MPQIAITNKHNLPETLVKAIAYDTHRVHGDISCTTLIDGPQIRILKRDNDYTVDVMDGLYAMMGVALHGVLERSDVNYMKKQAFLMVSETLIEKAKEFVQNDPEGAEQLDSAGGYIAAIIPILFPEINERYIFEKTMQLKLNGGWTLSGTFDLYDKKTKILYDYKFCSVYQFLNPESRSKWVEQTNIYAYMLMQEGYEVVEIRIVAFFRDWNKHGKMKDKDYPESQIQEIPIHVRPADKIKALIDKHTEAHMRADRGEVVPCNGSVRWAKADVYAVKSPSRKNSISNFDSMAAAEDFMVKNKFKYLDMYVETRVGGSMRCESYCPVAQFCEQRKYELQKIAESKK